MKRLITSIMLALTIAFAAIAVSAAPLIRTACFLPLPLGEERGEGAQHSGWKGKGHVQPATGFVRRSEGQTRDHHDGARLLVKRRTADQRVATDAGRRGERSERLALYQSERFGRTQFR